MHYIIYSSSSSLWLNRIFNSLKLERISFLILYLGCAPGCMVFLFLSLKALKVSLDFNQSPIVVLETWNFSAAFEIVCPSSIYSIIFNLSLICNTFFLCWTVLWSELVSFWFLLFFLPFPTKALNSSFIESSCKSSTYFLYKIY